MANEKLIAALLQERAGYVARNLIERIEAIDEALRIAGHEVIETATPQPKTERAVKPRARKKRKD
jgi:hypothetical protein